MTQRDPLVRRSSVRLVGGVHRDISGRAEEPPRFYLTIDRGLKSGQLDDVSVGEKDLLRLIVDAAKALELIRGDS